MKLDDWSKILQTWRRPKSKEQFKKEKPCTQHRLLQPCCHNRPWRPSLPRRWCHRLPTSTHKIKTVTIGIWSLKTLPLTLPVTPYRMLIWTTTYTSQRFQTSTFWKQVYPRVTPLTAKGTSFDRKRSLVVHLWTSESTLKKQPHLSRTLFKKSVLPYNRRNLPKNRLNALNQLVHFL